MAIEAIRQLAENFFNAIEHGDLKAVESIYAPDAIIWHNTDGTSVTAEENLEALRKRFPNNQVIPISASEGEGIAEIKMQLRQWLEAAGAAEAREELAVDPA